MKSLALAVALGMLFSGVAYAECLVREPGSKVVLTTKLKPMYAEHSVALCTEELAEKSWEAVEIEEVFNIFASQPYETKGFVPNEVIDFIKIAKNKELYRYWY